MATLIPIAIKDAQNAALLKATGADKKAFHKMGNKYAAIAKNPAKSAWDGFKSIFGFGIIVPVKAKRKPRPRKPKRK